MKIQRAFYSAVGKRTNNEDAFAVDDRANGVLAVVADGVGGSCGGELASAAAVRVMLCQLTDDETSEERLEDAVIAAHEAVCDVAYPRDYEAKTTLAALWIGKDAYAVHVGDSRIYQFRAGRVIYQSLDHSVAQLAVFAGEIPAAAIRNHPSRNRITRALGSPKMPMMDIDPLTVQRGDRFLLCSDGFWEKITEAQMEALCVQSELPDPWLRAMRTIVEKTEDDNHTAIALQIV